MTCLHSVCILRYFQKYISYCYAMMLAANHVVMWPEIPDSILGLRSYLGLPRIPLGLDISFCKQERNWESCDCNFPMHILPKKHISKCPIKYKDFLFIICFMHFHFKACLTKIILLQKKKMVIVSPVVLLHLFFLFCLFLVYILSSFSSSPRQLFESAVCRQLK